MPENTVSVALANDVSFDDFDGLHKLLVSSFAYMENRIDPPSSMSRLDVAGLCEKAASEYLIVASCAQRLVGCVFIKPGSGAWYLGKLAVDAGSRDQGVGRMLLERGQQLCREHACETIELEVRVELIENQRFFEKQGFVRCGENSHEGYERITSYRFRKSIE